MVDSGLDRAWILTKFSILAGCVIVSSRFVATAPTVRYTQPAGSRLQLQDSGTVLALAQAVRATVLVAVLVAVLATVMTPVPAMAGTRRGCIAGPDTPCDVAWWPTSIVSVTITGSRRWQPTRCRRVKQRLLPHRAAQRCFARGRLPRSLHLGEVLG